MHPVQVGSTVQIVSRASQPGRAASCSSRNFERARSRFAVFFDTRRSGVLRWIGPERFMIPPSSVVKRSTATIPHATRSHEQQRCCRTRSVRRPGRCRGLLLLTASRRRRCSPSPTLCGPYLDHESTEQVAGTLPEQTMSGSLRRAGSPTRRTRPGELCSTRPPATNSGSLPESDRVRRHEALVVLLESS